jgi:uncharacterized lipoprotein YbaY/heat shock protein HslJ
MEAAMRFLLALLALLLALPPAAAQDLPTVRGTAAYRERIALPPDAVLEAELQDVSRADAPAIVLGSFRAGPAGQVPIPFAIPYDTARIDPARRYVVRARILAGDRLLFTSDTAAPVLTQGAGDRVNLTLVRAAAPASPLGSLPATFEGVIPCADCPGIRQRIVLQADGRFQSRMTYLERNRSFDEAGTWAVAGSTLVLTSRSTQRWAIRDGSTLAMLDQQGQPIVSAANYTLTRIGGANSAPLTRRLALAGPRWVLVRIVDQAVTPAPDGRVPYLQFDAASARVSGDGGCNRLAGSYKQAGPALTIGPVARTMMACIGPAMDTENRFAGALQQVKTWSIAGSTLTLGDGTTALLQFAPR